MKRVITYLSLAVMSFALLGVAELKAGDKKVDWDSFTENLSVGLVHPNYGVRQSSMLMIVKHGDNLKLDREAVFELVRLYRSKNHDVKYRQLALASLNSIQDKWALDFLRRSYKFEDNPVLKRTIGAILLESQATGT